MQHQQKQEGVLDGGRRIAQQLSQHQQQQPSEQQQQQPKHAGQQQTAQQRPWSEAGGDPATFVGLDQGAGEGKSGRTSCMGSASGGLVSTSMQQPLGSASTGMKEDVPLEQERDLRQRPYGAGTTAAAGVPAGTAATSHAGPAGVASVPCSSVGREAQAVAAAAGATAEVVLPVASTALELAAAGEATTAAVAEAAREQAAAESLSTLAARCAELEAQNAELRRKEKEAQQLKQHVEIMQQAEQLKQVRSSRQDPGSVCRQPTVDPTAVTHLEV